MDSKLTREIVMRIIINSTWLLMLLYAIDSGATPSLKSGPLGQITHWFQQRDEIKQRKQDENKAYQYLLDTFPSPDFFHPPSIGTLRKKMKQFRGTELETKQEEALLDSLKIHGIQNKSIPGRPRRVLQELSQQNLRAFNKNVTYRSTPEMREAEKLISKLSFSFHHNTNYDEPIVHLPVLSSKSLVALGLGGGMHTREFNRDVVQNDNNVYFWIDPILNKKSNVITCADPNEQCKNPYGIYAMEINPSYARKVGWISRFMMSPDQLVIVAQENKDEGQADRWNLLSLNAEERMRYYKSVLKYLKQYDFTVNDFTRLVRLRLLSELKEIQKTYPQEFSRLLNQIKTGNTEVLDEIINRYVYKPMGITPGGRTTFEFKVPVAVPENQISIVPDSFYH